MLVLLSIRIYYHVFVDDCVVAVVDVVTVVVVCIHCVVVGRRVIYDGVDVYVGVSGNVIVMPSLFSVNPLSRDLCCHLYWLVVLLCVLLLLSSLVLTYV